MAQFKDLLLNFAEIQAYLKKISLLFFTNLGARFLVMKQDAINQASIC